MRQDAVPNLRPNPLTQIERHAGVIIVSDHGIRTGHESDSPNLECTQVYDSTGVSAPTSTTDGKGPSE